MMIRRIPASLLLLALCMLLSVVAGSPYAPPHTEAKIDCIAHRGSSAAYPENTMQAFHAAVAEGAAGIELDLRLTRDRELIVMHDTTLDRTTNCTGTILQKNYHGYIQYCRAPKEKVPLFVDVLNFLASSSKKSLYLLLDIKVEPNTDTVRRICSQLVNFKRADLSRRVILGLWSQTDIQEAKKYCGAYARSLIASAPPSNPTSYSVQNWNLKHTSIKPTFVNDAHRRNQTVFGWTVNDQAAMRDLAKTGANGIVTDYPKRCVSISTSGSLSDDMEFEWPSGFDGMPIDEDIEDDRDILYGLDRDDYHYEDLNWDI